MPFCRRPVAPRLIRSLVVQIALFGLAPATGRAADHDFLFSTQAEVLRDENVLRTGTESQDDYITTLRVSLGWSAETPRSLTSINYAPAYSDYLELNQFDNLEHRVQSNWMFTPGARSTFEIGQTYLLTEQQSGFQDFVDGPANPIVERTRREIFALAPSYRIEASRQWAFTASGTARTERFDSDTLIDSQHYGLEFEALHTASEAFSLGGRVRGDSFHLDEPPVTNRPLGQDRFVTGEAVWSGATGPAFSWNATAGAFWGSGGEVETIVEPTSSLQLLWAGRRGQLQTGYDFGFSTSGGLGAVTQSLFADIGYAHRFGRALSARVHGSRIRRKELEGVSVTQAELRGWQVDYQVAYFWPSGLNLSGRHRFVQQNSTGAERLEYQEIAVILSYVLPDKGGRRAPRARPGN